MSFHERLSALDASFLGIESDVAHMHVGALVVFEVGPLRKGDGIDFERIRDYVGSALAGVPRYRQRLSWVPGLGHPVWVDDDHFNIHYHLRHTSLPRPGDDRTLKRLAGRIFSQKLDRSRPLWEFWVVEGLTGDRFALIPKLHHCMIDGVAGVDFMARLLRPTDDDSPPESAEPWEARQAPSASKLFASELGYRAGASGRAVDRTRGALQDFSGWLSGTRDKISDVSSALRAGLSPASPTPLNPRHIGPHRRFDVCRMELERVKEVKRLLGGKVNDVVLTTATAALGRFLRRRGVDVSKLDDYRALVPVNVRSELDASAGGNRVAMMLAKLPIDELDPKRRYERVIEMSTFLKTESGQASGSQLLQQIGDVTTPNLVRDVFRVAGMVRAFNIVITNIPGPPFPLYLLGAKLDSIFPLVPLFENQAVGIALFSYAGGLYWGLAADWNTVPDLHELSEDLSASFDELHALAVSEGQHGRASSSLNA